MRSIGIEQLVNVYLDGMCSGVASALASVAPKAPLHDRDHFAQELVATVRRSPLALEGVRQEIRERLRGEDSGPYEFTLPLGGDQS